MIVIEVFALYTYEKVNFRSNIIEIKKVTLLQPKFDIMNNVFKKIIFLTFLLFSTMANHVFPQQSNIGFFDDHTDIGNVKIPGSVKYKPETQEYTIEGSGSNMWFEEDEFHFLWKRMKGNFILRARIEFIGSGVDPHRKIGWIIRNNLNPGSSHVNACIHGDGLTSLQFRRSPGSKTEEIRSTLTAPDIIQLERNENTYILSVAKYGQPFEVIQLSDSSVYDEVFVGLYICSHNPNVLEKAIFRNVRIIVPVKKDFIPYKDYIGSNIEVLDIETGYRKILFSSSDALEAPNWTIDGNSLIYNSKGLLYSFNIENKTASLINTGFANKNNNDHVISFDGKFLGISHHSQEDENQSIIYTVPVKGANRPKKITILCPSYLHGWSPDGLYMVYTASRNNQYDIYKISLDTKKEFQLTNNKGLDDGPEYSPDGKYIYFNSNRTGIMKIWRMKFNGEEQEQITYDEYNDWFPHISPDGKWIIFLSYSKDINSGDHPYYKHVYLRLMQVGTHKPRIIGYVYGGQGTINVPSWSPDSKKVAFISNSNGIN